MQFSAVEIRFIMTIYLYSTFANDLKRIFFFFSKNVHSYRVCSFNCTTKPGDFTASYTFRSLKHLLSRGDFKPSNERVQTDKRQISKWAV